MIAVVAHLSMLVANPRQTPCRLHKIVAPLQHPDLERETPALRVGTVLIAPDQTAAIERIVDEANAQSVKDDSLLATATVLQVDVTASPTPGQEGIVTVKAIGTTVNEIADVTGMATGIGTRTENIGIEIGIGRGAREIAILVMGTSVIVMAARNASAILGANESLRAETLPRLLVHLALTIAVCRHDQTQNAIQTIR